ncbi:MAG: hypothetical protein H7X88_13510, partial [Gloeobacteraceae cyanobacterium ES-bin-316]|nr:hypothetical protein [Ferruginibacter sp.]
AIKSKTETSGWLYNGISVTTQRPADLGYYVGFKICAAYYQKAPDKLQAISAILHIKNYQDFLIQSGYNPR